MITLIKKYIGNDKRYKINEFRDGEIIGLYHGNITKLTS